MRSMLSKPYQASGGVPAVIGLATPDDGVKLGIWRQGAAKALTARLANADEKSAQAAARSDPPA